MLITDELSNELHGSRVFTKLDLNRVITKFGSKRRCVQDRLPDLRRALRHYEFLVLSFGVNNVRPPSNLS